MIVTAELLRNLGAKNVMVFKSPVYINGCQVVAKTEKFKSVDELKLSDWFADSLVDDGMLLITESDVIIQPSNLISDEYIVRLFDIHGLPVRKTEDEFSPLSLYRARCQGKMVAKTVFEELYGDYERFTQRARKVMSLAQQEAQNLGHEYVGTEHILLGLIKEGSGLAANVLANLNVHIDEIRAEVIKIVQAGPGITTKLLPQTPLAKSVVGYAIKEANGLGHQHIGTEHLLLGLLREPGGIAITILTTFGVTLNQIRAEVLHLLGIKEPTGAPGVVGPPGCGGHPPGPRRGDIIKSFRDMVCQTVIECAMAEGVSYDAANKIAAKFMTYPLW